MAISSEQSFLLGFATDILYSFLVQPIRVTYPAHLVFT
jgi:hypothetical protein